MVAKGDTSNVLLTVEGIEANEGVIGRVARIGVTESSAIVARMVWNVEVGAHSKAVVAIDFQSSTVTPAVTIVVCSLLEIEDFTNFADAADVVAEKTDAEFRYACGSSFKNIPG